jgi:hypothetical protein
MSYLQNEDLTGYNPGACLPMTGWLIVAEIQNG